MNPSYIYPALGLKTTQCVDLTWARLVKRICPQAVLNPMQGFLNTLAFHGWTGLNVDFGRQRRRELPWDSASTSLAGGYTAVAGSALLYQSHVQEIKKSLSANGQQQQHQQQVSDAISVQSEGNGAQREHRLAPYTACWSPFHCHICRV